MSDGTPIAYGALAKGTPMVSTSGSEFGTVEHVLQIPEEDLFDGIVVKTKAGARFVDRDQITEITDKRVTCALSDEQARALPEPSGTASFHDDPTQDSSSNIHDRFARMFGRERWIRDKD